MAEIIFAFDGFNEYPQQYMGPKRKDNDPPPTWIDLVFHWENVDYTLMPVESALQLNNAWFYQVQIQYWRDFFDKGPLWEKINPAVQNAIIHGHAYWILSFAHEGIIQEALLELHKIMQKHQIPKHKVLFVSGAHNVPADIQVNTACINIWQSNLRTIWRWQTGREETSPVSVPVEANKRYVCFNRKPREHRIALLCMLYDRGVLDKGIVSCHTKVEIGREDVLINNGLRRYIGLGCFSHDTARAIREKLPMVVDYEVVSGVQSLLEFNEDIYPQTYFSVVTETFFRDELTFITEKVFRPIMFGHPFIVASTPHYLKSLRELGYETFPELFDESYDSIEDDKERLTMIANEVTRLSTIPEHELRELVKSVKEKLVHNRAQFFKLHPPTELLEKLNNLANGH